MIFQISIDTSQFGHSGNTNERLFVMCPVQKAKASEIAACNQPSAAFPLETKPTKKQKTIPANNYDYVMLLRQPPPQKNMLQHGSALDSFHPNRPVTVAYHGSLAETSYPGSSSLGRAAAQPGVASPWGIRYPVPTLGPSYLRCVAKMLINNDKRTRSAGF